MPVYVLVLLDITSFIDYIFILCNVILCLSQSHVAG
jgi:hypothetical protein